MRFVGARTHPVRRAGRWSVLVVAWLMLSAIGATPAQAATATIPGSAAEHHRGRHWDRSRSRSPGVRAASSRPSRMRPRTRASPPPCTHGRHRQRLQLHDGRGLPLHARPSASRRRSPATAARGIRSSSRRASTPFRAARADTAAGPRGRADRLRERHDRRRGELRVLDDRRARRPCRAGSSCPATSPSAGNSSGIGFFNASPVRQVGGVHPLGNGAASLLEVTPWSAYQEDVLSTIQNIVNSTSATPPSFADTVNPNLVDNARRRAVELQRLLLGDALRRVGRLALRAHDPPPARRRAADAHGRSDRNRERRRAQRRREPDGREPRALRDHRGQPRVRRRDDRRRRQRGDRLDGPEDRDRHAHRLRRPRRQRRAQRQHRAAATATVTWAPRRRLRRRCRASRSS